MRKLRISWWYISCSPVTWLVCYNINWLVGAQSTVRLEVPKHEGLSLVSLCENFVVSYCTQNSQIALIALDFATYHVQAPDAESLASYSSYHFISPDLFYQVPTGWLGGEFGFISGVSPELGSANQPTFAFASSRTAFRNFTGE